MAASTEIKAIDKTSVHRICSGQVILNIATAVKELVENSLDAGATKIEVRIKDHGKESIEVVDNGSGVQEANFEGLTLKHHTSKLKDFGDLSCVDTFGFRGEALSSLCALGNVTITTKHVNALIGHKIEFDHNGKLLKKIPSPRQNGTTVLVQNLFATLPVRHKEFIRNAKKEFGKLVNVLSAYCLISKGVKIQCSHINDKGNKSMVVNTNGNATIRDNITNVFGPKQMDSLTEFVQILPTQDICEEVSAKFHEDQSEDTVPFHITGYVSTCEHGKGRSVSDRQFLFVNNRPCDLTKVSRIINEVFHQFNRQQYPFVMLNVELNRQSVDINVTPDKRQLFLQNEKLLLAIIKTSLLKMYEKMAGNYTLQLLKDTSSSSMNSSQIQSQLSFGLSKRNNDDEESNESLAGKLKRNFSSAFSAPPMSKKEEKDVQQRLDWMVQVAKRKKLDKEAEERHEDVPEMRMKSEPVDPDYKDDEEDEIEQTVPQTQSKLVFHEVRSVSSVEESVPLISTEEPIPEQTRVGNESPDIFESRDEEPYPEPKYTAYPQSESESSNELSELLGSEDAKPETSRSGNAGPAENLEPENSRAADLGETSNNENRFEILEREGESYVVSGDSVLHDKNIPKLTESDDIKLMMQEKASFDSRKSSSALFTMHKNTTNNNVYPAAKDGRSDSCPSDGSGDHHGIEIEILTPASTDADTNTPESDVSITGNAKAYYDEAVDVTGRLNVTVNFSLTTLRQRIHSNRKKSEENKIERRFRAAINPNDNIQAEHELQKAISKQSFTEMKVLGQFNLGFIIAQLQSDLFIVDQHATDEKYNFETLQKTTVLNGQKMIAPQDLQLSVVNETLLMENLDIFRKNGFDFEIDEDAPCTQKVKLNSAPVSKNWLFGKSDIDEMLFMLAESPGQMCRPSRVRQMFASRACRKSIMIGTALSKKEMRKLLIHMSEIEQPWNCPHGRPTMRHLINLDMIAKLSN